MAEILQATVDLFDAGTELRVESHLIFDGLVGMNDRAMITAAKVKPDSLQ
jgi:hypothetical protein